RHRRATALCEMPNNANGLGRPGGCSSRQCLPNCLRVEKLPTHSRLGKQPHSGFGSIRGISHSSFRHLPIAENFVSPGEPDIHPPDALDNLDQVTAGNTTHKFAELLSLTSATTPPRLLPRDKNCVRGDRF